MTARCDYCGDELEPCAVATHLGECCDCLDFNFGMPLAKLNEERARKGKPPLNRMVTK